MSKKIMRKFQIREISAVDEPAQEGARMTLMKRKDFHQETGEEDGTRKGAGSNSAEHGSSTKESLMTEEEKKALEAKAAEADALKSKLAVSESYGKLNDEEKAHYNTLDDAGKTAFLAKSAEDRKAVITKSKAEDPVVYTADDGSEFKKSDDPRLVQMAKDRDADRKKLAMEKSKREDAEFSKRANEELKHLPGEEATKVALLKAVAGITDAGVRKDVDALLKANNEAMAKAFQTHGTTGGQGKGESDAEAQLNALAKKRATEKSETFEKAYAEVIQTEEGKALYEKIQSK